MTVKWKAWGGGDEERKWRRVGAVEEKEKGKGLLRAGHWGGSRPGLHIRGGQRKGDGWGQQEA